MSNGDETEASPAEIGEDNQTGEGHTQGGLWERWYQKLFVLVLMLSLFLLAVILSRTVRTLVEQGVEIGDAGTPSRLLIGVLTFQVLGFGIGAAVVLRGRKNPREYLRIGALDQWTLFYGAAVGLAMMVLVVGATVAFNLLDVEPAESAVGASPDPWFYLLLFVVSTFVAVPMEELFFRGILQRSLEAFWHPAVAIVVPSLLFVTIHTNLTGGTGGELIVVGLFFSLSIALGVSYYLTENLWVPIIGHGIFNGAQIAVQGLELAVS